MEALLDNDMLYKLARYDLVHEFERLLTIRNFSPPPKRVGSAPFSLKTIPGKISPKLWPDPAQANVLRQFFQRSSGATGSSAARLETLNIPKFDAGELQLVAYALDHPNSIVFTGDKRAIDAVCHDPRLGSVKQQMLGRFIHLEIVMWDLSKRLGFTRVASSVASAPDVDNVLTWVYTMPQAIEMEAALAASIVDLRTRLGAMLAPASP